VVTGRERAVLRQVGRVRGRFELIVAEIGALLSRPALAQFMVLPSGGNQAAGWKAAREEMAAALGDRLLAKDLADVPQRRPTAFAPRCFVPGSADGQRVFLDHWTVGAFRPESQTAAESQLV
jgi:hypothetical protein